MFLSIFEREYLRPKVRGNDYLAIYQTKGRIFRLYYLFQLNNVTPAGGGVLGFMVLLHGIGEYVGTTFTPGLSVLLGGNDDGFGAMDFVDAVDGGIEALQLLYLLGIHIEQILLDGTV